MVVVGGVEVMKQGQKLEREEGRKLTALKRPSTVRLLGVLFAGMGNLIKVLTRDIDHNAAHFFLDFENAQPTESEKEIYNQVNVVLKDAEGILEDLQSYRGAGHEIREHLEREQALAKQFAEILHFTLRFDELKMTNPAIQNDFSYYRRTLSRMRINNVPAEGENEVNNELANRMSLFYAEATPMLKTLSDATTKFVSEHCYALTLLDTCEVRGQPLVVIILFLRGSAVLESAGTYVQVLADPARAPECLHSGSGLVLQCRVTF
ncbi:hypothetical protein CB1_001179042 [Camelus ferus]|nr:hypothetical protein CB1_001179042 [Camelus ferus]